MEWESRGPQEAEVCVQHLGELPDSSLGSGSAIEARSVKGNFDLSEVCPLPLNFMSLIKVTFYERFEGSLL